MTRMDSTVISDAEFEGAADNAICDFGFGFGWACEGWRYFVQDFNKRERFQLQIATRAALKEFHSQLIKRGIDYGDSDDEKCALATEILKMLCLNEEASFEAKAL